jgi:hypothetical protein
MAGVDEVSAAVDGVAVGATLESAAGVAVLGYVANGALAMVAGEAGCTPKGVAVELVLPVAARLRDEGEAAGCKPVAATACGEALAEGKVGPSDFDASAVWSDDFQGVHQAQRGPDWQPTSPAIKLTNKSEWTAVRFIDWLSRFAGTQWCRRQRQKRRTSVRYFGALAVRH